MSNFLKEFKEFAMKGNVVDMAVGVIIGGAFGKIVSSLVADIIMPFIGLIVGGVDFTAWKWVLVKATEDKPEVAVTFGNFLQVIFDFLIVAFVIFAVIKAMNKVQNLRAKEEEAAPEEPAAPAEPSEEVMLLREIRDELRNSKK
ncbi:MAG: large-conductance mechanosensitive channel protein MscL [Bacteroidales bacterium]|nr:large-conductance mechanosensitive channel protein MscL [Bacteroidales bacterium]